MDIPDQPDFVKLAEAYRGRSYRVSKLEDLEPTLRTAFASPNTAIIDVIVERDENVYPTVASGASLDEIAVAVKRLYNVGRGGHSITAPPSQRRTTSPFQPRGAARKAVSRARTH